MIIAAVATHATARHSAQHLVSLDDAVKAEAAMANKIAMWVFPLGIVVFGAALRVGLLLYLVSDSVWTLVQQRLVFARIER